MRRKKKRVEKSRREGRKEENVSGTVKRRCEGLVSVEASEILVQGDLESCGDLS